MVELVISMKPIAFEVKMSKGQHLKSSIQQICSTNKGQRSTNLTNFWNPQFSSDWLEIWTEFSYQLIEFNQQLFFSQNWPKGQHRPKVNNFGEISKFLNFHPIDLKFEEHFHISSLNSTTNYFGGPHQPKGQQRTNI